MSQSSYNESTVADSSQVDLLEQALEEKITESCDVKEKTLEEKIIESCDVKENDEICSAMTTRTRQIVTKIENIQVGSEISYGRWGYKHHAVVVDVDTENDKYQIIHLSGDSVDSFMASSSSGDGKAKPRSEWMTMRQTKEDKSFYYDYKTNGTAIPFEPDVIKGRAEALMKVFPGSVLYYDVQKFNCQHFASYCVTGVPYCKPYNKMLCCCKRGTAINSEVKKILDDQLKGKKTPSPEKERIITKKDEKHTEVLRPQPSRPLPFETQYLKTDNNGRAQVSTDRWINKPRPLPSISGASVVRPLPRIPQVDQLGKGGLQLEPLEDSTSEKKKKERKRKRKKRQKKELKQFVELD